MGNKISKESKVYALIGYVLLIFGFIVVYALRKKDKYAMHYAKQGLVLFLIWIPVVIIKQIAWIGPIIESIMKLTTVIILVMGIFYILGSEDMDFPVLGFYARKLKL